MLLVFTFLNPHTYLDTSFTNWWNWSKYTKWFKKYIFLGAVSSSTSWFILLGFGARFLIPLFKKPITWKILDILIGIIMLIIAYTFNRFNQIY